MQLQMQIPLEFLLQSLRDLINQVVFLMLYFASVAFSPGIYIRPVSATFKSVVSCRIAERGESAPAGRCLVSARCAT